MTQTQHTPTPYEDSGNSEIIKIQSAITLETIAFLKPGYPMKKANAAFIVKACNSYDDMKEETHCSAMLVFIEKVTKMKDYYDAQVLIKEAFALIKKVRG